MSKIALFGAAGAIGQSIAAAIGAKGQPYRVVGRTEASLRKAFGADPLAEIVTWNPDSPTSVQAAATGVEALIYLVGVNYTRFELHPELMRKTLAGAIAAALRTSSSSALSIHTAGRNRGRCAKTIRANPTPSRGACAKPKKTC